MSSLEKPLKVIAHQVRLAALRLVDEQSNERTIRNEVEKIEREKSKIDRYLTNQFGVVYPESIAVLRREQSRLGNKQIEKNVQQQTARENVEVARNQYQRQFAQQKAFEKLIELRRQREQQEMQKKLQHELEDVIRHSH